jgi:inorganic pyrophosphatase
MGICEDWASTLAIGRIGSRREEAMTALDRLPTTDRADHLRAVIETPQGSRNKLSYDPVEETFAVSSSLPAGMSFPFDFGFIPGTLAEDGDPLDVLVLMDAPAFPGCLVEIRLLGVLEAEQTERSGKRVRNDRVIAVAKGSTERGDLQDLTDLDPQLMIQIETFFATYNELAGKTFRPRARRGRKRAERLIRTARRSRE